MASKVRVTCLYCKVFWVEKSVDPQVEAEIPAVAVKVFIVQIS